MAKELWHGYPCETFEFEGRQAALVFPEGDADEKKNWTLKMEYRGAYPETELALVKKGFHAAYLQNHSRFAPKEDCDAKARFAAFLRDKYGLRDQCVPVGMSCGGAHSVNFAGYYPDLVACMWLDAPVLNFISIPGKHGNPFYEKLWDEEFVPAYPGITRVGLFTFDNHPIAKADILHAHKIPIILSYGTEDQTVLYQENGRLLEEVYGDLPDLFTVIPRGGQGHLPHGFPSEPEKIADFILQHTR